MVDLHDDTFDAPNEDRPSARRRPTGRRRANGARTDRPSRRPRPTRTRAGSAFELGPFLFLLAALAPLAGAIFRIIDLVGIEGLVATKTVGPRLQLLGNAVNPLTGLLLVAAIVVAVMGRSTSERLVAGMAVAIAGLLLVVASSVAVAAIADDKIFTRTNDAHVEVISYEIGGALVAIGVMWLALRMLRRPDDD